MVVAWQLMVATTTGKTVVVIVTVGVPDLRLRCNAHLAAACIMPIAQLPERQVRRPFVQASQDMRSILTVTAMASDANDTELYATLS